MQLHMHKDGMKPNKIVLLIVLLLFLNCFMSSNFIKECKADVLPKFYVDDDYDSNTPGWQIDHFDVIQDAIDVSTSGDRILVYAGTYSETITINHNLDVFGEDKDLTIITGTDSGDRITILASNVNISHFTIQNCGSLNNNAVILINSGYTTITDNEIKSGAKHGIYVNNCDNNIIYDNVIKSNNGDGIYVNNSDSNFIAYNSITSNSNNGLFLYNSSDNTIQNNAPVKSNSFNGIFLNETSNDNILSYNNCTNNDENGIFLNDHCDNNILSYNEIYENDYSGIRIENSSSITISNSILNGNSVYGILLVGSDCTIQKNILNYNDLHGIYLFADDNNLVINNTISYNIYDGMRLSNSTNDSIYNNEIFGNSRYGINLDYFTIDNLIYNNYFHDNSENAVDKSLNHNTWYTAKILGTNKVLGPYKYGNYWDDFDETSEGAIDSNGDGIADSAYTVYASNKDNGPLLDVIAPTISTPQAQPSTQSVGGYTYISATVTDYIEVRDVYISINDPNSQNSNISILANKNGDTYYYNNKFSEIGRYTFRIIARDSRNWVNSSIRSFNIDQGSPPKITDNTLTFGSPSNTFIFNASVVDDADTNSTLTVMVNWTHGSKGGNDTLDNVFGKYFEKSVVLDKSIDPVRYIFYACDQWGNSISTKPKTVTITDTNAPKISIVTHGSTFDIIPNSFTFGATITDDHKVELATIEYWYENADHNIVNLDKKSNNYYEKVIFINENPSKLYCIITATDPSGNQNDTKKPFARTNGPYAGVIGYEIIFNATDSFDLDGEITDYLWDFGDGITGSGEVVKHTYNTNGNYVVKLTITDNDENVVTATTNAKINPLVKEETSYAVMSEIEEKYGITLSELFYCYDIDGDDIPDNFADPNKELKAVHTGHININGNIVFLLSIDDDIIPEFMWNYTTDTIISINSNIKATIKDTIINDDDKNVILIVDVAKSTGWIYFKVSKPDIEEHGEITDLLSVDKNGIELDSDMIIKKGNDYFILDDPDVEYQFIFLFKQPPLSPPQFIPSGGTIGKNNPTVKIIFNTAVEITYADFYNEDTGDTIYIESNLKTSDNTVFYYKPPNDLIEGEYVLYVEGKSYNTNTIADNYAIYSFVPYEADQGLNIFQLLIVFGIIGCIGGFFYILFKKNILNFESFVYIKNKKIIPFLKPLIFGPLRIDVNNEKIKKAEFYVNGKLKDTITKPPFVWDWNETSFMKKTIETKIFDEEGKSSSSGEMTFFVFNSPRFFK